MAVKLAATMVSATAASEATGLRPSAPPGCAPSTPVVFVLAFGREVGLPDEDEGDLVKPDVEEGLEDVEGDADEDGCAEDAEELLELLEPPGGGVALEGSRSLPTPQPIF